MRFVRVFAAMAALACAYSGNASAATFINYLVKGTNSRGLNYSFEFRSPHGGYGYNIPMTPGHFQACTPQCPRATTYFDKNIGEFHYLLAGSGGQTQSGWLKVAWQGFATEGTFSSSPDSIDKGTITIWKTSHAPEPATWALLILGMGAVGGALRRRTASGKGAGHQPQRTA